MVIQVGQRGAHQSLGVDASMLVEALVLDGDQRLAQLVGDVIEGDPGPTVLGEDRLDPMGHVVDGGSDDEADGDGDAKQGR